MWEAWLIIVLAACAAGAWLRPWRCRHRYGAPMYGYVNCLRCTRRFPLITSACGEWQIGKRPLDLDPPQHPPLSG